MGHHMCKETRHLSETNNDQAIEGRKRWRIEEQFGEHKIPGANLCSPK